MSAPVAKAKLYETDSLSRRQWERDLAERDRLKVALRAAVLFIEDDTCRHDSEKAAVLFAARAALGDAP